MGSSVYADKYDRIAPLYDVLDLAYEISWKRHLRRHVFAGTSGLILDAGAGTGCNMPYYPEDARVVAVDASGRMLARAARRAARHGRRVEFHVRDLVDTGFPGDHFDHAVATFVFCVLPEHLQVQALRELARIVKPQGTIRLLDYTMSKRAPMRLWMRLASPWLDFAFAARYTAGYETHLTAAGLALADSRFVQGDHVRLLVARRATGS